MDGNSTDAMSDTNLTLSYFSNYFAKHEITNYAIPHLPHTNVTNVATGMTQD